jgi:hypothetical protein
MRIRGRRRRLAANPVAVSPQDPVNLGNRLPAVHENRAERWASLLPAREIPLDSPGAAAQVPPDLLEGNGS